MSPMPAMQATFLVLAQGGTRPPGSLLGCIEAPYGHMVRAFGEPVAVETEEEGAWCWEIIFTDRVRVVVVGSDHHCPQYEQHRWDVYGEQQRAIDHLVAALSKRQLRLEVNDPSARMFGRAIAADLATNRLVLEVEHEAHVPSGRVVVLTEALYDLLVERAYPNKSTDAPETTAVEL